MKTEQIAQLLTPFSNDTSFLEEKLALLSIYLDLLMKWNSRINLTSVRNPAEIVTRHFGESLFAARQLFPNPSVAETVIDIGSGAGFPGLPLKIWAPELMLSLIESNQKKAVFLREVVRALGLSGVDVLQARAEGVSIKASLVTLRAVEHFTQILPIASRLLKPAGRLALLIGSDQADTAESVLSNMQWNLPIAIPLSERRILLIGRTQAV